MCVLLLHSQEGRSWAVTMEDLHRYLSKVSLIWQNPVYQKIKFYTMSLCSAYPEKVESSRARMGASPSRAAWYCWDKPSACQVQSSIPAVPDCSHPCFDTFSSLSQIFLTFFHVLLVALQSLLQQASVSLLSASSDKLSGLEIPTFS